MEKLIPPVDKKLIKSELNEKDLLRYSRMGKNEIYVINYINGPNIINEIGRLRELTFRSSGGGIGISKDIDHFDLESDGYNQLIVWEPIKKQILGGYRFRSFPNSKDKSVKYFATGILYNLSNEFINNYLPHCIDLGRAFILTEYQTKNSKQNIFVLDNIWDGLGALINKNVKYFIGRIIIYPQIDNNLRDLIIFYMDKHFNKNNGLLNAKKPFEPNMDIDFIKKILTSSNHHEDFILLKEYAQSINEVIPPLINAYIKLSPSLQSFGAIIDPSFGNLYEICIMIKVKDIYPKYLTRYKVSI